jgi:transcriptional regulator with XRE-family HTH domain
MRSGIACVAAPCICPPQLAPKCKVIFAQALRVEVILAQALKPPASHFDLTKVFLSGWLQLVYNSPSWTFMPSLGEDLKRERELRDISLREISEATKISMRILEAIEGNNYKILPGGIFNRNFIRAYAEFIGVDPEGAVNKYCQQATTVAEEAMPRFQPSTANPNRTDRFNQRRLVIYGIVLLILLSLLFLGLYRLRKSGGTTSSLYGKQPVTRTILA